MVGVGHFLSHMKHIWGRKHRIPMAAEEDLRPQAWWTPMGGEIERHLFEIGGGSRLWGLG